MKYLYLVVQLRVLNTMLLIPVLSNYFKNSSDIAWYVVLAKFLGKSNLHPSLSLSTTSLLLFCRENVWKNLDWSMMGIKSIAYLVSQILFVSTNSAQLKINMGSIVMHLRYWKISSCKMSYKKTLVLPHKAMWVSQFISSCMDFVNCSYKACIELHLMKCIIDVVLLAIRESSGTYFYLLHLHIFFYIHVNSNRYFIRGQYI